MNDDQEIKLHHQQTNQMHLNPKKAYTKIPNFIFNIQNKQTKFQKQKKIKKQTFPEMISQQSLVWLCFATSSKVWSFGSEAILIFTATKSKNTHDPEKLKSNPQFYIYQGQESIEDLKNQHKGSINQPPIIPKKRDFYEWKRVVKMNQKVNLSLGQQAYFTREKRRVLFG